MGVLICAEKEVAKSLKRYLKYRYKINGTVLYLPKRGLERKNDTFVSLMEKVEAQKFPFLWLPYFTHVIMEGEWEEEKGIKEWGHFLSYIDLYWFGEIDKKYLIITIHDKKEFKEFDEKEIKQYIILSKLCEFNEKFKNFIYGKLKSSRHDENKDTFNKGINEKYYEDKFEGKLLRFFKENKDIIRIFVLDDDEKDLEMFNKKEIKGITNRYIVGNKSNKGDKEIKEIKKPNEIPNKVRKLLNDTKLNFVVIDILFKGSETTGIRVINELHSHRASENKKLILIAFSAFGGNPRIVERCYVAGADIVIPKGEKISLGHNQGHKEGVKEGFYYLLFTIAQFVFQYKLMKQILCELKKKLTQKRKDELKRQKQYNDYKKIVERLIWKEPWFLRVKRESLLNLLEKIEYCETDTQWEEWQNEVRGFYEKWFR